MKTSYKAICTYCGWSKELDSIEIRSLSVCGACKDKNIKVRKLDDDKIDYYQGCPPFPTDEVVLDLSYEKFIKLMEDGI